MSDELSDYARGLADGKRAAVREIARALDMIARDVDRQLTLPSSPPAAALPTATSEEVPPRKAPPKLGVGVDRARLERFLRVTSNDAKPAAHMHSPAPPAVAMPVASNEPPLPAVRGGSEALTPAPPPHADRGISEYVRQRASQWWERACDAEQSVAVRAEARAIAGELFEIAETIARGETLR